MRCFRGDAYACFFTCAHGVEEAVIRNKGTRILFRGTERIRCNVESRANERSRGVKRKCL